jgi:oligosaccharide repeat unit polymerase
MLKKGTDIFSPARLFAIVWTLVIGLTELKLSRHQIKWSMFSWLVLLISLVSVLLGMFIIYVINYNRPINSIPSIRNTIQKFHLGSQKLFNLTLGLFVIYIISYAAIYLIVGFIPLFTAHPNIAREKWSVFGLGLIVHLAPTIIYLTIFYMLVVKKDLNKKLILILSSMVAFITFLFLLQRFDIVISIVLSVVALYYGTFKFRARTIIIVFLMTVILMYTISTIRVNNFFIQYLYYSAHMKFSAKYAMLTEPYMYVVMNLENFANAVDKLSVFSYGTFTFDFALALSGLKHTLIEYNNVAELPYLVNGNYNTYSMFFVYYRDYGVIGVFVFPLLVGLVISTLYYKMLRNPNINTISVYGICTFVILFSFFIPMLSWLHFVLNLSTIYFVTRLVQVKDDS